MFRLAEISKILLIVIGLVVMTGCDGRKSSQQALKESLRNYREDTTIEIKEYYPEDHFQFQMDTLLDSGYRIHIKTWSDPNNEVIISQKKDGIHYQKHHSNFIFNLRFFNEDELLLSKTWNKTAIEALLNKSSFASDEFEDQVLNAINVDYEKSTRQKVVLNIRYRVPDTLQYKTFEMHLFPHGGIEIKPT
jgi:hypothetical protein